MSRLLPYLLSWDETVIFSLADKHGAEDAAALMSSLFVLLQLLVAVSCLFIAAVDWWLQAQGEF